MSGAGTGVLARLRQPVGQGRAPQQLVGGSPQVSLLPGEVRAAGAVAAHRRILIGVVVAVALVAGGTVVLAQQAAAGAQGRLATAEAQSAALAGRIAKFKDVQAVETSIERGKAAVRVGSSTMIDWQAQVDAIEAAMPSNYTVTAIGANGATPLAAFPQGTSLLQPTRVATITMTVTAPTFGDEFSAWMRALKLLPSYAGSTTTTTLDSTSGSYTTVLTLHLSPTALSAGTWTDGR